LTRAQWNGSWLRIGGRRQRIGERSCCTVPRQGRPTDWGTRRVSEESVVCRPPQAEGAAVEDERARLIVVALEAL
jgi:hypothetical protein